MNISNKLSNVVEMALKSALKRGRNGKYLNFGRKMACPVCGGVKEFCGVSLIDGAIHCHFPADEVGKKVVIFDEQYRVFEAKDGHNYKLINFRKGDNTLPLPITKEGEEVEIDKQKTDAYFRFLFKHLDLITEHERFASEHWGLEKAGYLFKSNNQAKINKIIDLLYKNEPESLKHVSGLKWVDGQPTWPIYSNGVLIPLIQKGLTVGCQVRVIDKFDTKNRYMFTPNVSETAYSMIDTAFEPDEYERMIITEGIPKAISGARALGCGQAIGLTGISKYDNDKLWEEIENQKGLVRQVYLAPDHDKNTKTRKTVNDNARNMAERLFKMGFQVFYVTWEGEAKGIDDAIRAGLELGMKEFMPRKIAMTEQEKADFFNKKKDSYEARQMLAKPVDEYWYKNTVINMMRAMIEHANGLGILQGDTGIGKTHSTIEYFRELLEKNSDNRIMFALPNYTIIDEYMTKIKNDDNLMGQTVIFRGRNEDNCNQFEQAREIGAKGHNVNSTLCVTCPFKDRCKSSGYLSQFDLLKDKRIILIPHALLSFFLAKNERGETMKSVGEFTHVFIDESPMNTLFKQVIVNYDMIHTLRLHIEKDMEYGVQNGMHKDEFGKLASIKKVCDLLEQGLDDAKKQEINNVYGDIFNLKSLREKLLRNISVNDLLIAKTYFEQQKNRFGETLLEKVDDSAKNIPQVWIYDFFEALYEYWEKDNYMDRIYSNPVSLVKTKTDSYYNIGIFNDELARSIFHKNTLILDGTADEKIWGAIALRSGAGANMLSFGYLPAKVDKQAVKFIYANDLSKTMNGMKSNAKDFARLVQAVKIEMGEKSKIGAIFTKDVARIVKNDVKDVKIGYYGKDHKGSNDYEHVDALIVSGYNTNLGAKALEYEALTGHLVDMDDNQIKLAPNPYSDAYYVKNINKNDNFNHFYESGAKADVYQAVQRARLAHRHSNKPLTIIYTGDMSIWGDNLPLFNQVMDFGTLRTSLAVLSGKKGGAGKAKREKDLFIDKMMPFLARRVKKINKNNVITLFKRLGELSRAELKQIAEEVGVKDVRTLLRYFKDVHFIKYLIQMMKSDRKKGLNKSNHENFKDEVFSVERISTLLKRALAVMEIETELYGSFRI